MFSDVHNRIHFTIAAKVETRENHAKVDRDSKYVKWNQIKSQQFVNDLFSDENGRDKDLDEKFDAMLSHDDVTDDCIDDIVSDLQNIFVNTAKYTFGYKSNEQRSTDLNKNPWFDNTCKEKRDEFRRVRDKYRFDQSDGTKEELNLKETAIRRQMNSSFKKFQENNAAIISETSKNDTKKMWKILNNMNGCKKENVDIPIDNLYEYFKDVNENYDEAGTFLHNICDNQIYDDILNGDITEDEVLNAIKNLNNDKAAGIDDFVNEYFKYSSSQLVYILLQII
jgi:hypothetical protein